MSLSPDLLTLARHLAGIFENREQAAADPAWYVHLRLWQCPVHLFADDSVALFAEQANSLNLDKPYRQRILRLQRSSNPSSTFQGQYYQFKQPEQFRGAGQQPEILQALTLEHVELLPGCILDVNYQAESDRFVAMPPADARCCFQYNGETRQVVLGFEISTSEYLTYDKGVDPATGQALWGAIMGPYRYKKMQQLSDS